MKYIIILLIGFLSIPATSYAEVQYTRNLTVGSKGQDVVLLQNYLILNKYLGNNLNTGYFGQMTKIALKKYQKDKGLPQTGFFGVLTRQKMLSGFKAEPFLGTWYVSGRSDAWITFEKGKISGKVCNNFSGALTVDANLNIETSGDIVSTMMYCTDTDIQNLESMLHKLLTPGSKIILDSNTGITITGSAGKINFTKKQEGNISSKKDICTSVEGNWYQNGNSYTCASYNIEKLTEQVCNSMGSNTYASCGSPLVVQDTGSGNMLAPAVCMAICANIK